MGAFSDGKVVIQDSVTECHKVAVRFVITGKHAGAFMGIAPTGKPANVLATGIFRIVDGKADDNWVNFDAPRAPAAGGSCPGAEDMSLQIQRSGLAGTARTRIGRSCIFQK